MASRNNRKNINIEKIVSIYISKFQNKDTNEFMIKFMKEFKEKEAKKLQEILEKIQTYRNCPKIKILDDIDTILKNWHKIPNSGHQNCGIYISEKFPDKILKCSDVNFSKIFQVVNIESIVPNLFPKIHEIYNLKYTIMDKVNGDLSVLCYKILPIELISITEEFTPQRDQILRYLDLIIPKMDTRPTKEEFLELKPSLFDRFFRLYLEKLLGVLRYITYQIIFINIILAICGYKYVDNKLDNYSFKIITDRFVKESNPILDNKVFFRGFLDNTLFTNASIEIGYLDWDSGLEQIDDISEYREIFKFLYNLSFNKEILNISTEGQSTTMQFYTHFGKYHKNSNNTLISNEPQISYNNHSASKTFPISHFFNMNLDLNNFFTLILNFCHIINSLYHNPILNDLTVKFYSEFIKYFKHLHPEFFSNQTTNTRRQPNNTPPNNTRRLPNNTRRQPNNIPPNNTRRLPNNTRRQPNNTQSNNTKKL